MFPINLSGKCDDRRIRSLFVVTMQSKRKNSILAIISFDSLSQYTLFHVTLRGIIQLLQNNTFFIKFGYETKRTKKDIFYKVTKSINVVNSRIKLKHNVLQNSNSIITQFVTFAIYKIMRHIAREPGNVIILLLLTKKRIMNKRKELYLQRINNTLIYNSIAIKDKSVNTDHTKKTYREASWKAASLLDNEASK